MISMGFEVDLSPAQQWGLVGILAGLGVCVAMPASLALAAVGGRRAVARSGWKAFWYWAWGTALTVGVMYGLFHTDLRWWAIPVAWVPGLLLSLALNPRNARPSAQPEGANPWPRPGDPGAS
jgi:hypothetical protein